MENQNINQEQAQEQRELQGWKDVNIVTDMPLTAIVHFLNVLNQRLCNVEDNLTISLQNKEEITLTELYQRQAQEEKNNKQGE